MSVTPQEQAALDRYTAMIAAHYPPHLAAALAAQQSELACLARKMRAAIGKAKKQMDTDKLPATHPYREALAMVEGAMKDYA
jgi:hypothetical protein